MKHQAAYSLLFLSGNSAPTQAQVEEFMSAVGVSVDKEAIAAFFKTIEGKSVPELVKEGEKKQVTMPRGGGGGAAAEEAPVEEEKKEEVEDVDMGGLFGDDDDDY